MHTNLFEQFNVLVLNNTDLYTGLNAFRDWFNQNIQNYEFILDDEWFEEKTTIEYQLRSLDTFNIIPLAVDTYENNRDNRGVWHLGKYQSTEWMIENPAQSIQQFIAQNTSVRYKF